MDEETNEPGVERVEREVVGNSVEIVNGTIRLTSSTTPVQELVSIACGLHNFLRENKKDIPTSHS